MSDLLYKMNKSKADIETLLDENKNLVYHILTLSNQLQNQEAESAAWDALWDAICTFDVFCETAFSTWACTLIKNRIGDVLRAQKREKQKKLKIEHELQTAVSDTNYVDKESKEFLKKFKGHFDKYISFKTGVTRDVLIMWYSTGFECSVTNLAAACNCSASFVSRIQVDFRAYIYSKLRGN